MFLIKYNTSGAKQWTKMISTSSDDHASSLAIDFSNNVYVAGTIRGSMDGNTNKGNFDKFIMKFNLSGTKQ